MSLAQIQEFYNFTFRNERVQEELIETSTIDEFVSSAIKLGRENGFSFTREEFISTMSGLGQTSIFDSNDFDNDWIRKVMQMGWVPLGYSR